MTANETPIPMRFEIVVIGSGPAGVAAATEAGRTGARVALISEGPLGGHALASSLLPSKVLLRLAHARRRAKATGLAGADFLASYQAELTRIEDHQRARTRERLDDVGVHLVAGAARFTSATELHVTREGKAPLALTFERCVVATGSSPVFPPRFFGDAAGPDGERVLAPRHLRRMTKVPATLLVIGGGATGAEMVDAFDALGVEVTWLLDDLGILPRFDRELASSLGDVIMERGTKLVHGKHVTHVGVGPEGATAKLDGGRTYAAERAFVAVGRRPDLARLDLAKAGFDVAAIEASGRGLAVDAHGRTSVAGIYAAGDAAGPPFTSNKARAQGYLAGRHATQQDVAPLVEGAFIETVYTEPELARVGVTPEEAARRGLAVEVRVATYEGHVAGVLQGAGFEPHVRGLLKVVLDGDERILGGIALGPSASELLAPIATAIQLGAHAPALRSLFLAEPSLSEIALAVLR